VSHHPFIHHPHPTDGWLSPIEGQLSVDVIETPKTVVIRCAIAGVKSEDLDISVTADTLTIRGKREACETRKDDVVHLQECYWGAFSRSIVLPHTVGTKNVKADLHDGILTVTLPKMDSVTSIPVTSGDPHV